MDRDERSDTEQMDTQITQWMEYTHFYVIIYREQTTNAVKVDEGENEAVREVLPQSVYHV